MYVIITHREILSNQTEIKLYIPFSDWFENKWTSVWFKINRKMVNSILFRKYFSVRTSLFDVIVSCRCFRNYYPNIYTLINPFLNHSQPNCLNFILWMIWYIIHLSSFPLRWKVPSMDTSFHMMSLVSVNILKELIDWFHSSNFEESFWLWFVNFLNKFLVFFFL